MTVEASQAKILSFAPFGNFMVHNQVDMVTSLATRLRGADFAVVLCDGIYKDCDVTCHDGDKAAQTCQACALTSSRFFGNFQVPSFQIRNYIREEDWQHAEHWVNSLSPDTYSSAEYNGLPFGDWAISSISSSLRITRAGLSYPKAKRLHRQYIINAFITYLAMERIIEEYCPTSILLFNGRFAPYRVVYEMSKRKGIPCVVHERGYVDDTFILFENHHFGELTPFHEFAEAWRDIPLSRPELERLKQYFMNREAGKDSNFVAFIDYQTEYREVKHRLRIPEEKRVFTVFTSSEYELAFSNDYQTDFSQLEVIGKLIEVFRERDDILVIRHHPYIAGNSISPPDWLFLSDAIEQGKNLPPNIKIVYPTEQLSTYALFWNSQASISFFSSTGPEGLARGLPVACFRNSQFREITPFHLTDFSKEGLSTLVENLFSHQDSLCADDLRRLYRNYYSTIMRLSLSFKTFGIKDLFCYDLRFSDISDLQPGGDPLLDRLCDSLIHHHPILSLPTEMDHSKTEEVENAFFEEELQWIHSQRNELSTLSSAFRSSQREPKIRVTSLARSTSEAKEIINWMTRSRYQQVVVSEIVHPTSPSIHSLLESVYKEVKSAKEEYILLNDHRVKYTEAFLSQAIDLFLLETNASLSGVRTGIWILDASGKVKNGVFSTRNPCASEDELSILEPRMFDTTLLLSTVLFRREPLLQLLARLMQHDGTDPSLAYSLFEELLSEQYLHSKSQFALVQM